MNEIFLRVINSLLSVSERNILPVICPFGFDGGCQLRYTTVGSLTFGIDVTFLGAEPGAVRQKGKEI